MHKTQLAVKQQVALGLNDTGIAALLGLRMTRPTRIHADKTPPRLHYIVEWAEHRQLSQADLARLTGADKGTVSRWFGGTLPRDHHLEAIAAVMEVSIKDLMRDPYDDWMKQFFSGRSAEEMERIKATLEAAFPRKTG